MSQRQFIPLDDDSLDCEREFDLTKMTAMDYLKGVRFERKIIPQVVTVHPLRKTEDLNSARTTEEELSQKSSACETFHPQNPTKEWREIQKEKFSEMQMRIVEMRLDPSVKTRLVECEELSKISNEKACIEFCRNNDPMLSKILSLGQGHLEELIELLMTELSTSISDSEFPKNITSLLWLTKWIYALLACLRSPLDPEVHNCLRLIAKSCIKVTRYFKAISEQSSDSFLPWNLITVVIALNFQQFDLLSL